MKDLEPDILVGSRQLRQISQFISKSHDVNYEFVAKTS